MAKAKAKATPTDPAELAVHETLKRAQRVWNSGLGSTLDILKDADQRLGVKLQAIVAKHGGPSGKFTEASATVYRKQIALTTEYLEARLAGHTHAQATKAIAGSVKSTIATAKAFEHKFTGITRPLALETQHHQDAVVKGTSASLLQRHTASFNRYGKAMVADFEKVLRGAQLEGLTHEQTVSRLIEAGKAGGHSATSLNQNEPQHFPQPTSYVKRRYWAERIVRTETAYALGAGALAAMHATRQSEFPDLQKKILATFDDRTAADSVAVHGQVRKLEEYFMDGAGRTYLHPPGRPNDRETVIPWRPHWENTPTTAPPPAEVQAKAEVEAQAPGPGENRKVELKDALAKAKAKILGQKAAAKAEKDQAQAFVLAQSKAAAAQAEGQQALGHAVLADEAALKAAADKLTHAKVPGAKFDAAKAKAAEYLATKQALAKAKAEALAAERVAKAEALAAERQAKLTETAKSVLEVYQKPGTFESGAEVLQALKGTAKQDPKMFGEMFHQATGKPASSVVGLKPLQMGKAVKQLAKKLQPDLTYPEPKGKKKKLPELTPEQALAQKKAALLAHNADLKTAAAAFTDAEVHMLLEDNPLVLAGEVDEVLAMSPTGKGAYLHQVAKDWEELKAEASKAELKPQPSGGKHYVDVYQGGKKTAYYFQEGTAEAPHWVVKPPQSLASTHPELKFTQQVEATAYALDVGKKLAEEKLAAVVVPSPAKAASPKYMPPPTQPGEMRWSKKYQPKERAVLDVKSKPAVDVAEHLVANRAGHQLALDEDWIENFEVSFSREKIGAGEMETVVRFKVTEHRAEQVEKNLLGKTVDAKYHGLADLKSEALDKAASRSKTVPGVLAKERQVGTAKVRMYRSNETGGANLAANHNLVEMRFPGTPADAMEQAVQGFKRLGIKASRPTAEMLLAQKRATIMAKVDPDSLRELNSLKDRSVGPLDELWKKAVLRNPKLAEIEADVELRQVAPGKHALYSQKLAKLYQDAGVTFLEHDMNPSKYADGLDAVRQIFVQSPGEGALLSSRERYQRGLFYEGQSTSRDFETGGADSVFTRVRTTVGTSKGSQWTFEIDPSELGRLDSYAFNGDNYGVAGPKPEHGPGGHSRQTTEDLTHLLRTGGLSSGNELMLQRQVPATSIRRIMTRDSSIRADTIKLFRDAGLDSFNGVPIEEFVVTK